ncbi:MAG: type II secretion system secretin GspD [Desulfamplus sp.]|nr:type II secretion system secretin GspD [Desulfamplus sp.]
MRKNFSTKEYEYIQESMSPKKIVDSTHRDRMKVKVKGGLLWLSTALILLLFSGCTSHRKSVQILEQPAQAAPTQFARPSEEPVKTNGQNGLPVSSSTTISTTYTSQPVEKNLAIFDEESNEKTVERETDISSFKTQTLFSSSDDKITTNSFNDQLKGNNANNPVLQGQLKIDTLKKVQSSSIGKEIGKRSKSSSLNAESAPVKIELAFDNADLFEVLDATLFELYKVNYIIDPHVRAKVSFHFSGSYTKYEFIALLNDILQLSNLSITQGPGDMFKVVRKNESAGLSSQDIYEDGLPDASGDISRLIRLKYLDAAGVLKSIQTFTSKGAPISIDTVNNSIIVTDTLENVEKVINVLAMMDVPYFMDISWRIFPVKEIEAKDIVQNITKLIKSAGLYYRPGALKGGYEILSIDSINAILVATRWPEILDLVDKWISAMDYLGDDAGNGTGVFVYFVENGTAVEMADILKQLYGGKASGSSSQKTQIVKPTEKAVTSKNKDTSAVNSKTGNVSGDLSGDVEIIPDETNNAIIFKASQRDYKIIKNVLKELDVTPRQVLINVVIAEVTLNDKTQYGVQWLLNNKLGNYQGQGGLDIKDSSRAFNQALGTVSNISYGIYNSTDVLKGLVTALGSDSKVNILSSPNIMAVDNKEAMIEVGEDVPTLTGSVTDINGGITNSVQYKKTGIILNVTPHINSSGLVKMELSQEVSARGSYDEVAKNYPILTRKAETSLVVNDQQTILMGGLMRSQIDNSDAGVPFLKDIPVLGYLFKGTTDETKKTELIFLLTPHVVDSREAADRVTREFAAKIESIKNLIEKKDN